MQRYPDDTHIDLWKSTRVHLCNTLKAVLVYIYKLITLLFSVLIQNIVTSTVKNRTMPLQLVLGILFDHSRNNFWSSLCLIRWLPLTMSQKIKKVCGWSYAKDDYFHSVTVSNGLFHTITENFDTEMSSQNKLIFLASKTNQRDITKWSICT